MADNFSIHNSLEVLSILSVIISVVIEVIALASAVVKNVMTKSRREIIPDSFFDVQTSLFNSMKMCSRCGFLFWLFAWLLFVNTDTYLRFGELAYDFGKAYGAFTLLTVVVSAAIKIIGARSDRKTDYGKQITWLAIYSLLYFVVGFLVS